MKKDRLTIRGLAVVLSGLLALVGIVSATAAASLQTDINWANPRVMALKQVSTISVLQDQPNLLSNMDCTQISYRLTNSSTIQSGCFSSTAFGLLNSANSLAIFNGTDEALPLVPYSSGEVLAPWPGALDLIAIDAVSTGGSYVSLYRDLLTILHDQRDDYGQLVAKQLRGPPDLRLTDPAGQALIINPQTLAFSAGGSWLVAEDLTGSFLRINLTSLDKLAFAQSFGSQGSPALLKSQVAVSSDGRYVAIENNVAASFKVYDLATCISQTNGLPYEKCQSYDYWLFIGSHIGSLTTIRHVRFVNNGLLSFEVLDSHGQASLYEIAPTSSITALINYLGIGDSYTSGEGAFDYLVGTDTDDNHCHLSINSYPLLLTRSLFGEGGHSVACSGAVIEGVGSTSDSYVGQINGGFSWQQLETSQPALLAAIQTGFRPGFVAQQRFASWYQPEIMTVSVGGNDIGFGDIIRSCVEPHLSLGAANTCYSSYEDRRELLNLIDRTGLRLSALYRQLLSEVPSGRLYVIGYPQIVFPDGNCAINVHLNHAKLQLANALLDYLNDSVRQAAQAAGAEYVDISQALAGHRLCEAASYDVAINGLTAGKDAGPLGVKIFGAESYHPNAFGQTLIAQAILRQTNNLAGAVPVTTTSDETPFLLNAPKTGRPLNVLVSDNTLTTGVLGRNIATQLVANSVRDGLESGNTYAVRLDGVNGPAIGMGTSGGDGSLFVSINIPASIPAGGHTIDIIGSNQAGQPIDVRQSIYVVYNNTDSDGDGLPDNTDSCPGATNSGIDADRDGVDDVCDGLIGQGSTDNSSPGQTNAPTNPASGGSGSSDSGIASSLGQIGNREQITNILDRKGDSIQPAVAIVSTSAGTAKINLQVPVSSAILPSLHQPDRKITAPHNNVVVAMASRYRLCVINWLPWIGVVLIFWSAAWLVNIYLSWRIRHRRHAGSKIKALSQNYRLPITEIRHHELQ